jgi:hypothetical protein
MTAAELNQAIISRANSYIGQKEKSRNSGFFDEDFEMKMKQAGWVKGYPWCASFVRLVYIEIISELFPGRKDLIDFLKRNLKHGVLLTYKNLKTDNLFFEVVDEIVPGGIVFYKTSEAHGHTGIAKEVISKTTFKSIEGNTNAQGSREGEYVAEKLRTVTQRANWVFLGCAKLKGL